VLRHWLRAAHAASASAAQLEELLQQVADCTTRGHRIRIKVGRGFVERQGERLHYAAEAPP
jgi:tRNA(Ile)-lysidine synthase